MSLIQKLKKIKGHRLPHNDGFIEVVDFVIDLDEVELKTTEGKITMTKDEIYQWLFKVEGGNLPATGNENIQRFDLQIGGNVLSEMVGILKENISKVKADKEYIPQAAEINKNVNSIINLAKTEVELLRIAAGK